MSAKKTYKSLVEGNLFGVRDKIKELQKNPNKRRFNKRKNRR